MAKARLGAAAPDFDLPTDNGGRVRLSALKGKMIVLYFYPADDTEGCTLEAIDFSRELSKFEAADTVVIGISPDSTQSHGRFRAKHGLTVLLAADQDHKVIQRYGLWVEKTMFGRKYMGVERATFLIDRDGKIIKDWRKVRVKGHVEAVVAAVQAL